MVDFLITTDYDSQTSDPDGDRQMSDADDENQISDAADDDDDDADDNGVPIID